MSFPNWNPKTFFLFWMIITNNHSMTSFAYRRWRDTLNSHLISWSGQMHFSPFFHSRVYIYTPKFNWYLKKEAYKIFPSTKNSTFEKGFSTRISSGLSVSKSQNFRAGKGLSNTRVEWIYRMTLSSAQTVLLWKGHFPFCLILVLSTKTGIPGLNSKERKKFYGGGVGEGE